MVPPSLPASRPAFFSLPHRLGLPFGGNQTAVVAAADKSTMTPKAARPLTEGALKADSVVSLDQSGEFPELGKSGKAAKPGLSARLQAGIAEFLLITRLRARRPAELAHSADVVACGAHVVQVTCKNWFVSPTDEPGSRADHRTRL